MIKAIFFATFDVDEGPKLHHLLPEPLPGHPPLLNFKPLAPYLIPPPALCNTPITLLTPTNRQPGSPKGLPHRILSHPVYIASEHYPRNAFTFNFGLVLEGATEFSSYLPIVKKIASLFRGLEEQGHFLSKNLAASATKVSLTTDKRPYDLRKDSEEQGGGKEQKGKGKAEEGGYATNISSSSSKIYAICEILLEDLNNYGETQIPLDAANTLNLKLFPTYAPPPPLYAWHVPLATVSLTTYLPENCPQPFSSSASSSGDLTMTRILPYIDGVNSVHRIAQLADADFKLVRKAIRHLLYYGCCILLDIFAFGAIYAPTSTIASFIDDEGGMQEECVAYVSLPLPFPPTAAANSGGSGKGRGEAAAAAAGAERKEEEEGGDMTQGGQGEGKDAEAESKPDTEEVPKRQQETAMTPTMTTTTTTVSGTQLCELYLSLRQGLSVKAWCLEHPEVLRLLDIRRFITFGVIKGFLYRVHKYAILASSVSGATGKKGKGKGKRRLVQNAASASVLVAPAATATTVGGDGGINETGDEAAAGGGDGSGGGADDNQLVKFLDGTHCFDEICTELGISERDLLGRLKERGADVQIICR